MPPIQHLTPPAGRLAASEDILMCRAERLEHDTIALRQKPAGSHVQALPSAPVVSRLASVWRHYGPLRTSIDLDVGRLNVRILQGRHFSWDEELKSTPHAILMTLRPAGLVIGLGLQVAPAVSN